MSQKEAGVESISKIDSNLELELEMELANKTKLKNDTVALLKNKTGGITAHADSDSKEETQERGNPSFIQDGAKPSVSNKMKQQDQDESQSEEEGFNLPPESLASAQKVLGHDLTLRKNLSHISGQSYRKIFELRLVNKLWEAEATSIIMNLTYRELNLKYEARENCFYQHFHAYQEKKIRKRPLSELNESISSSRRFPCASVKIDGAKTLETPDMLEFLRLHGHEIKNLSLSDNYTKRSHELISRMKVCSLQKLLTHRAPNIKSLSIYRESEVPDKSEEGLLLFPGPEKVILPNLQTLSYFDYMSQISEIILAAPNLQKIGFNPVKAVDALVSMNKVHLIKDMDLSLESEDPASRVQLVEKLAEARPKFTSLRLVTPTLNMGKPLTKILDATRESLKDVDLYLYQGFFNGVHWPTMENVTSLQMSEGRRDVQTLPPNFITDVFPNIVKLVVSRQWSNPSPNNFLGTSWNAQLPRLKIVKINHGNPRILYWLARAAPNIEELELFYISHFCATLQLVWGFSKLRKLSLRITAHQLFFQNRFPQLDMAITGLSEDVVRRLFENPAFFEKMTGQELVRVRPSILDCQALETMVFNFKDSDNYGMQHETYFTAVSGKFGFKMMSHVKMSMRFTECCEDAFKPLALYINLNVSEMKI